MSLSIVLFHRLNLQVVTNSKTNLIIILSILRVNLLIDISCYFTKYESIFYHWKAYHL